MFSRFHHRRGHSTPTSPVPPATDSLASWEPAAVHEKNAFVTQRPVSSNNSASHMPASHSTASNDNAGSMASTTPATSSIPPVSRMSVMTVSSEIKYDIAKGSMKSTDTSQSRSSYSAPSSSLDMRRPPTRTMTSPQPTHDSPQAQSNEPTFIGGLALANLRRSMPQDLSTAAAAAAATAATGTKRPTSLIYPTSPTSQMPATTSPSSAYNTFERRMSRQKAPPPPINTGLTTRQHLSPTIGGAQGKDGRTISKSATSFITPTDLQSSAAAAAAAASAVNSANDVYHNNSNAAAAASHVNSSAATAAVAANARTKKSRPFLKNPVSSLLGRRKTTASTPEPVVWAAASIDNDGPVYVPFRGTRVHDFSAPRQPRIITNEPPVSTSTAAAAAAAAVANSTGLAKATAAPTRQPPAASPNTSVRPRSSDASDGAVHVSQAGPIDIGPETLSQAVPQTTPSSYPISTSMSPSVTPDPNASQSYVTPFPKTSATDLRGAPVRTLSQGALQTLQENDTISFDEQVVSDRLSMEGPMNATGEGLGREAGPAPVQASSTWAPSTSARSRATSADFSSILKPSPSTVTLRSRNVSISELSPNSNACGQPSTSATTPGSAVSAVPRHMKSTSSRFSFMVGSSEEKVLEERHRQKQAEKATNTNGRDYRFYDSDEEDFDYEAMLDEGDDFEERIPGVNADFEEDDYHLYDNTPHVGLGHHDFLAADGDAYESKYNDATMDPTLEDRLAVGIVIEDDDPEGIDPNNDQENFAGFVFQRSNPASSLVSPTSAGIVGTPRDATGHAIGFAMTKDTTPDLNLPSAKSLSPMDPGLLNVVMESHQSSVLSAENGNAGGLGIQHMATQACAGIEVYDDYSTTENLNDYEAESDYDEPTVTVQHVSDPFQQYAQQQEQEQAEQAAPAPASASSSVQQEQVQARGDDLYFDQGLADELDFGAPDSSAPFDENLFDLPDTDQYGRPLPGVFAAAQAAQAAQRNAMAAAVEAAASGIRRESEDPSSGMYEQSQFAEESTAHTSTSISQFAQTRNHADSLTSLRHQLPPIMTDAERVAAYQAALSEAAFKAAAQGKFRRDPEPAASNFLSSGASPPAAASPSANEQNVLLETAVGLGLSVGTGESAIKASAPAPAPVPVPVRSTSGEPPTDGTAQSHLAYAFTNQHDLDCQQNFEEDDYLEDMDDYDFDDDIIAEANAEALANDMDGFYGQEFNFYSAPANQGPATKEIPQYAHGGYFIPEGIGRSVSGRVVSREPNLTPITERSEYSNRNSVMSLAVPPYGSSAELRSPGLAQLAMLADDNDMSISALLRLRSKTFGGSQASSREGSPMLVPPGGMSMPGSAPASASASALGFDRDRGDRDSASSPYDQRLTPAQLQLLQKQYALPPSHYQHHQRMNSGASQLSRGAGSSDYNNSEGGSDCGSPTLTNLQAIPSRAEAIPPVPPLPQSLPLSPIPAGMVNSVTSSCTPVLEEDGEGFAAGGLREPSSTAADLVPARAPSGRSSASGSGLWVRSPVTGSLNAKHNRHNSSRNSNSNSEQQIQDLQYQLQLKELENERIQRENDKMQQKILALEQKKGGLEQPDLASPTSTSINGMPPPSAPPMSGTRTTARGHRRKGSAESVSYVMTGSDDAGQNQWVVEHRRTSEAGEVEILKREYVDHI